MIQNRDPNDSAVIMPGKYDVNRVVVHVVPIHPSGRHVVDQKLETLSIFKILMESQLQRLLSFVFCRQMRNGIYTHVTADAKGGSVDLQINIVVVQYYGAGRFYGRPERGPVTAFPGFFVVPIALIDRSDR